MKNVGDASTRAPPPRANGVSSILGAVALALASLLSVTLAVRFVYPRLTASQHLTSGEHGPAQLPWVFTTESNGNQLLVHLPVDWATPRRWNITPDDRLVALRINGRKVALAGVRPGGLTDFQNGFDLDLSPWLHRGDNDLEFTVDNTGGRGGLTLCPLPGWRILLLAAGLLPWLLALALTFRLRRSTTAVLCGALLVSCAYWGATPFDVRSYDVKHVGETGHLDYVVYVAEHLALPVPNRGWEYYQPPLYYVGGALAWRWAASLGIAGPQILQAYSLALWQVFLVASAATLERAVGRSSWAKGIGAAGLALWPSGVIHSLRIGNDAALYATAAVATWFMFRWWRSGQRLHFLGMSLSIAAALMSKSNASALVAAALALTSLRVLRRARWRRARTWVEISVGTAIVSLGIAASVGRNFWYWRHGQLSSWLVGSIGGLDASLRVPNEVRYFVPLDVPVFVSSPWVDSRDDATGRSNFWNYLLRSSLSGEFKFEGDLRRAVAIVWGVGLLWLLALLLLRFYKERVSLTALWREAPLVMLGAAWLASVLCSRTAFPYSCQGDFRFIVPVLVPFLVALVRAGHVARGLVTLIAASSFLFFVTV